MRRSQMEVKLKSCGDQRSALNLKITSLLLCVFCVSVCVLNMRYFVNIKKDKTKYYVYFLFATYSNKTCGNKQGLVIQHVYMSNMLPYIPLFAFNVLWLIIKAVLQVITNKHLTKVLHPGNQILPLSIHIT